MKNVFLLLLTIPLFFSNCGDKEDDNGIKISKTEYLLNYEDNAQIEASSKLDITYSSESEYVAKVSSSGQITAGRVGETKVLLNNGEDSKSVKVTVEPKYNLFPEPIHMVKFGDSKANIIAAFGSGYAETSTAIGYQNYHKNYDYIFLIEDGKMITAGVLIPTLSLPDNLADFMTERYQIVSLEGYQAAFLNEKQDMAVGMAPTSGYSEMLIIYLPFNSFKSTDSMNSKEKILRAYADLKGQTK